MRIHTLTMTVDGVINAQISGHATEVINAFHSIASIALGSRGPWRITDVHGEIDSSEFHDSAMIWRLMARNKNA